MHRSLFLLALAGTVTAAAQPLSLHVEADPVPPGAMAQVRVYLRGGAASSVTFDIWLDSAVFERIATADAHSATGDQYGALQTLGPLKAKVRIQSAAAGLGRVPDQPILTFQTAVLASARPGSAGWIDVSEVRLNNTFYPAPVSAWFEVGGALAFQRTIPAFGPVEAGETIQIEGQGFTPDLAVELEGVATTPPRFVSGEWIELVALAKADLTGRRLRIGARTYYCTAQAEGEASILPFFPARLLNIASPAVAQSVNPNPAVAVRNPGREAARVVLQQLDGGGVNAVADFRVEPSAMVLCPHCNIPRRNGTARLMASHPVQTVVLYRTLDGIVVGASMPEGSYAGASELVDPETRAPPAAAAQTSIETVDVTLPEGAFGHRVVLPVQGLGPGKHAVRAIDRDQLQWLTPAPLEIDGDAGSVNLYVSAWLPPGEYTAIVDIGDAFHMPVTLRVTPASAKPRFTIGARAGVPVPWRIVGDVTPGATITLHGNPLGEDSQRADGLRVTFDGVPATVRGQSATHIEVDVPQAVQGRAFTMLEVEWFGLRSRPWGVPVTSSSPRASAGALRGDGPRARSGEFRLPSPASPGRSESAGDPYREQRK